MLLAGASLVLAAAALAASLRWTLGAAAGPTRADVSRFLTRYVEASGRVVRRDQGNDTVSEGQAYALLLSVASGQEQRFATVWGWTSAHLQQSDGLLGWHWAKGHLVGAAPAADADLDTAWALALAAHRFHHPAYLAQARRMAGAILARETTRLNGLGPVLVAGPWARRTRSVVNPSYWAFPATDALARLLGSPRWAQMGKDEALLLRRLTDRGTRLPPDWASLEGIGIRPLGRPGGGGQPSFGLGADRTLVWLASSCRLEDKVLAASMAPLVSVASRTGTLAVSLSGRPLTSLRDPVPVVATAAAAAAGNHDQLRDRLLERADALERAHPTYYGAAWVALGRVLLTTEWLSPCAGPR